MTKTRLSAASEYFHKLPVAAWIVASLWTIAALSSGILFLRYLMHDFEPRHMAAAIVPYGAGWLAAWCAWHFSGRLLAISPRQTFWLAAIGIVILITIHQMEGFWQFGGYDFSYVVDTAWRMYNGQKPYTDFLITAPPGFYLVAGYAFRLFGAQWAALVTMGSVTIVIFVAWATALLARLLGPRPVAALIALTVAAMSQLVLGIWWYNPATTLAAALFVLSALELYRAPDRWFSISSYVASIAVLLLMKPNTAGLLVLGVSLFLAVLGWRWAARVAALSMLGAALAGCILLAHAISPVAVLLHYREVTGRALKLSWGFQGVPPFEIMANIAMICAFVFPVSATLAAGSLQSFRRAALSVEGRILTLAAATAVYTGLTNGEWKSVAGAIFLLSSVLFVLIAPSRDGAAPKPDFRVVTTPHAAAVALCAMFAAIGCGTGWYRLRVLPINDFFEWRSQPPRQSPAFFKGLVAGRRFNTILDQIDLVSRSTQSRNVFFGPRMNFAYAAFGYPAPKGQPILYEPGTVFAPYRVPEILRSWQESNFDLLVFFKNDFTFYPPEFLELIRGHYTRDDSLTHLTLFRRNGSFVTGLKGALPPEAVASH